MKSSDDFPKCIFCDSKVISENGKFIFKGALIFRIDCPDCHVNFFLSKNGLDYYIINMGDNFDKYMLLCEIGPNLSCLYHNGSIVIKDIPQIFNPREANSKLKTLLVFS